VTGIPTATPPLHVAVAVGSIDSIKTLLDAGAQVNQRVHSAEDHALDVLSGILSINEFVSDKSIEIAQVLLRGGASLSGTNASDQTPFQVALSFRQFDLAQLYIDSGNGMDTADIDTRDDMGRTPLMGAVTDSLPEIVSFLLKNGANPNAQMNEGLSPVHGIALQSADIDTTTRLAIARAVIDAGGNINIQSDGGLAPLHLAPLSGKSDVIHFLAENGADLEAEDSDGATPLVFAVRNLEPEAVQALLERGANAKARTPRGNHLLPMLVSNNDRDDFKDITAIARMLISHGADLDGFHPAVGGNALFSAALFENKELFKMLAEAGADLDAMMRGDENSWSGKPLLSVLMNFDDEDYINIMLVNGANPNITDFDNMTPLHDTARSTKGGDYSGQRAIAQALIEYGAEVDFKGPSDITPLQVAAFNDNAEVAEVLINNGADTYFENKGDVNAMDMAREQKSYGVASVIRRARK